MSDTSHPLKWHRKIGSFAVTIVHAPDDLFDMYVDGVYQDRFATHTEALESASKLIQAYEAID